MTLNIASEDPNTADAAVLIDGSEDALRASYSVQECSTSSLDELSDPSATFLVARLNGQAVGCVALIEQDGQAQVKRLFSLPTHRGQGIDDALMEHIESRAHTQGHDAINLKTGAKLEAAVRLYKRRGYVQYAPTCGNPNLIYMTKPL